MPIGTGHGVGQDFAPMDFGVGGLYPNEAAVNIAPPHKLTSAVPGLLKNDLPDLRAGILNGTIATSP